MGVAAGSVTLLAAAVICVSSLSESTQNEVPGGPEKTKVDTFEHHGHGNEGNYAWSRTPAPFPSPSPSPYPYDHSRGGEVHHAWSSAPSPYPHDRGHGGDVPWSGSAIPHYHEHVHEDVSSAWVESVVPHHHELVHPVEVPVPWYGTHAPHNHELQHYTMPPHAAIPVKPKPEIKNWFGISFEKNAFVMNGEPFRYISGSIHYFRIPRQYWRDRLRKMRAAGLNAVSTFVEWSLHEPQPGTYNFTGDLDLEHFIGLAQAEGLFVILRPGPYICAERDMGGLPYWLLSVHSNIYLRSSDERYLEFVRRWMNVLFERVSPLLYGRGGPIILVQIENHYGSYWACDYDYTTWLRDLFRKHVEDHAVLFTTDVAGVEYLRCGKIPGVYATVEFGPSHDADEAFNVQRVYEWTGPLVNSQYYSGRVARWGEDMAKTNATTITRALTRMLDAGANINFYMFSGGTNFGFTNGADYDERYIPHATSYDYDAPISEAGDLTDKYFAIKEVIEHYFQIPGFEVETFEKGDYGKVELTAVANLLSPRVMDLLGKCREDEHPMSFEMMDQGHGYVAYQTTIPRDQDRPTLHVAHVHDYGTVYVDGIYQGYLSREDDSSRLRLERVLKGSKLSIVVENRGRISYGSKLNDPKGILSSVILEGARYGHVDKRSIRSRSKSYVAPANLTSWTMTGFDFGNVAKLEACYENVDDCRKGVGFTFYMGKFVVPDGQTVDVDGEVYPLDSFLNVMSLTKGIVFVNNRHLGRYWSTRGPQYSVYVPGVYLKPAPDENVILIMDETINSPSISVTFSHAPVYHQPNAHEKK